MDGGFKGLDGIRVIYDDILVYGCGNIDEEVVRDYNSKLIVLMDRWKERVIKLNFDKLKLGLEFVIYMGYVILK